jgi:(2R)-sulfolactate sulfo-lyase subunit beta
VGVAVDRLIEDGATVFFGETSELTGGEHLVAERMATPELREEFQRVYDDYVELIETQSEDLLGSQPTQGNIAGGLSTIEEKALGNIEKTGTKPVVGVLGPAEAPHNGPGLYFMDIDVDVCGLLSREITLPQAGDLMMEHLARTANGRLTSAEALGHREFTMTKLYRSA